MKPCITVITIAVDNLERSLRFYRDGLGLKTEGIFGTEFEYGAVVFFDLQAGLKLRARASLSIPASPSATELTLGHNVSTRVEDDVPFKQFME